MENQRPRTFVPEFLQRVFGDRKIRSIFCSFSRQFAMSQKKKNDSFGMVKSHRGKKSNFVTYFR